MNNTVKREYSKRAFELDPKDVNRLAEINICLTLQRKHEEAIEYLDKAISIKPDFLLAYTWKTQNFIYLGRPLSEVRKNIESIGLCKP